LGGYFAIKDNGRSNTTGSNTTGGHNRNLTIGGGFPGFNSGSGF
jgi:hypothetical protein